MTEAPVVLETASKLPPAPITQQARESVTSGPRIVPLQGPDRTPRITEEEPEGEKRKQAVEESVKERAQRLLREAAQKHKKRAAVMQGRLDAGEVRLPTDTTNGRTPGVAVHNRQHHPTAVSPRSLRTAQFGVLTVAIALIAVVIRRMILMSTTI